MKKIIIKTILLFSNLIYGQDISLYSQFNGNIDFTMIGNTLNHRENEGNDSQCSILTNSSTTLNLDNDDYIEAAYLYWAGSGTGDFDVSLNGINLNSQRNFTANWYNFNFFGAFVDVTDLVRNQGNGNFTLANLDLNVAIQNHCEYGINFGGWAIVIVYSNSNLPINQINVYDGMQSVIPNNVTIQLQTLNVIDNTNAKIGFLAWEGDSALAVSETLTLNGNVLGNPPLNPYNNAFNGTNSFTGESNLYNMDLDVYDIENHINIGDTSATIELTSGQDFVMINSVVTKLNSQLPDAACLINNYTLQNCNKRIIEVNFDIINTALAQAELTTNIPVSIYANNIYLTTFFTQTPLGIDSFDNYSINITIPNNIPNNFELKLLADDDNGASIINEIVETNNESTLSVNLPQIPVANNIANQFVCSQESNTDGIYLFDTSAIEGEILGNSQQNMDIFYFDSLGNSLSSPLPNPFPSNTQIIDVIVQNPNNSNCTANTTIQFTVVPLPEFSINDNYICFESFPEITTVFIENPLSNYNYQWFNANSEHIGSNQESLEITSAGNYSVTATSRIYNCTTTKEFTILSEQILFSKPENILLCNQAFETAFFDLESINNQVTTNTNYEISYFTSINDLHTNENEINTPNNYLNTSNPQIIFVKITSLLNDCYNTTNFNLLVENCLPIIPELFTPNETENNTFTIRGLKDIFPNFELQIYNRYGNLIFEGDNNTNDWDGTYKGKQLPSATYFFILKLNDGYFEYEKGWVYLLN